MSCTETDFSLTFVEKLEGFLKVEKLSISTHANANDYNRPRNDNCNDNYDKTPIAHSTTTFLSERFVGRWHRIDDPWNFRIWEEIIYRSYLYSFKISTLVKSRWNYMIIIEHSFWRQSKKTHDLMTRNIENGVRKVILTKHPLPYVSFSRAIMSWFFQLAFLHSIILLDGTPFWTHCCTLGRM